MQGTIIRGDAQHSLGREHLSLGAIRAEGGGGVFPNFQFLGLEEAKSK